MVAGLDQPVEPAVEGGQPAVQHDRRAGRRARPRHRLQQVAGAGPAGGGEPAGDDRVLGGQHGQPAAADLLEHLGRVAVGAQPDGDQRRDRPTRS